MALSLYMVAPKHMKELAVVVIAGNEDDAKYKALEHPLFGSLPYGTAMSALNLTEHYANAGYIISVTKDSSSGVYH